MELKDTIPMMDNSDYKERFRAEWFQLKIRHRKLHEMLEKWRNGKLEFEPTCPYELLDEQRHLMWQYMRVLSTRAILEGIDLKEE